MILGSLIKCCHVKNTSPAFIILWCKGLFYSYSYPTEKYTCYKHSLADGLSLGSRLSICFNKFIQFIPHPIGSNFDNSIFAKIGDLILFYFINCIPSNQF